MKEDMMRRAIGGIDPRLAADAAPGKKRGATVKKIVAAALAVMVTTFGLLMLNAQVRAAVLGSFMKRDGGGVSVYFADPDGESESDVSVYDVTVEYIPDGLIMEDIKANDDLRFVYLEVELGNKGGNIPYIQMSISHSGAFPWGWGRETFDDRVYQSTINGMDAHMIDFSDFADSGLGSLEGGEILFGDENITVKIDGYGLRFDEVIKIAENVTW